MRPSKRAPGEMRHVRITRNYTKHAEGSVLVEFGDTRVLCNASVEERVPGFLRGKGEGWVTADTHVHFLSPSTARLEGAAEGVNVINLLASQWGELMTNVGDFDGKTTFGSREAGGDGEWLVRVGTENRQHVLGHISLLGYGGEIIAPMCAGGVDEAARTKSRKGGALG